MDARLKGRFPDSEHIYVESSAKVNVVPDVAEVSVKIAHIDSDLKVAKTNVEARIKKLWELVDQLNIETQDMTASQTIVHPEYDFRGQEGIYLGYCVKKEFRVALKDIQKFNELIKGLTDIPVSDIREIVMSKNKIDDIQEKVLSKAIKKAKRKAQKIAIQLNASLGPVYSISATDTGESEEITHSNLSSKDFTGVDPGIINVQANVCAVFRLNVQ